MKRIWAVFLAAVMLLCLLPQGLAEAATVDVSTIRVKLSTNNATSIAMGVSGEFFIEENGASFSGGTLTLRSNFNGTMTAIHSSLGELYTGSSLHLMRVKVDASGGSLTFNSRRYLGHMYAKILSSGYIQIINEVPLAHYLYGVVAYEMNNNFPLDALRAQAVAAKSYALTRVLASPNGEYHIGDTSSDQVYKGYNPYYTNVISAVDSTINDVLTVNGSILCAYYSASNGGETALPTDVWPTKNASNAGFGIALDDPDLQNAYSLKETATIPVNSAGNLSQAMFNLLLAKLTAVLGITPDGISVIKGVEMNGPRYRGAARNMTSVSMLMNVIVGGVVQENVSITFSVNDLITYGVFSNTNLRTYWGEYSRDQSSYYIYHVRWGHGVGLSQRGAQQRGTLGQGYRDILAFYYPGASLSTIQVTMPADPKKPSSITQLTPIGTGVTTGRVNVRTGSGTSYPSQGMVEKGTLLTVYELTNGWYRVQVNGSSVEGYISGSYVSFTPSTTAPAVSPIPTASLSPNPSSTLAPAAYGLVINGGVNLRDGAGTSANLLAVIPQGEVLPLYSASGTWYYAQYQGIFGFVSSQYVRLVETATVAPGSTFTPGATVSPSPSSAPGMPSPGDIVALGKVTGSGVNFRKGPDTSYDSIGKLAKNTTLILLAKEGKWYRAIAQEQGGYIHQDYVQETGLDVYQGPGGSSGSATGAGVTTGSVNMRVGPGTTYEKVTVLSKGTTLTLYQLRDGWYEAETAAGKKGWVSSKYVTVTTALPEGSGPAVTPETGAETPIGAGITTATVNFREKASTSSKVISKLSAGKTVTLYELAKGWYRAEYNGTTGWLFAKYVKQTSTGGQTQPGVTPEGGGSGAAVILASGQSTAKVNMRTGPSTSGTGVIATLSAGTAMNILGETGEWYYVLYDGKTGFCFKAYVKVVSSGTTGVPKAGNTILLIATSTTAEVNFRTGPGTTYPIMKELAKGTAVTVYWVGDGWCLVSCGGAYGYLSADYVKLN